MLGSSRKPATEGITPDRLVGTVRRGLRKFIGAPGVAGATASTVMGIGPVPGAIAAIVIAAAYEEFAGDEDADVDAARRVGYLRTLLPDAERLELPWTTEGNADRAEQLLEAYGDDRSEEFERAVERILSGDFSDVRREDETDADYLCRQFQVETREEAAAILLDIQQVLRSVEVHREVAALFDDVNAMQGDVESIQEKLETELQSMAADIQSISDNLQRAIDGGVRDCGFSILTEAYFASRSPRPIPECLQTGFRLIDVKGERAFERHVGDEDKTSLVENLATRLQDPERAQQVIIGPPGSGKTVLCRQVGCHWFDEDIGGVFYRSDRQEQSIDDPEPLMDAIDERRDQGTVLIVVEDVVDPATADILSVLENYMDDERVAVLLEARRHEWEPETFRRTVDRPDLRLIRTRFDRYSMPGLDKQECKRLVAYFSEHVDHDVEFTGESLWDRLVAGTTNLQSRDRQSDESPYEFSFAVADPEREPTGDRIGDMLVASYLLATHDTSPEGDLGATGLEATVDTVVYGLQSSPHDELGIGQDADVDRVRDVVILLNLLNVMGFEPCVEYCRSLAVGDGHEDLSVERVDELLSDCRGIVLFGNAPTFRMYHELWSVLLLQRLSEAPLGGESLSTRVTRCVESLLAVVTDDSLCKQVLVSTPSTHKIGTSSGERDVPLLFAESANVAHERLVTSLYEIGYEHPSLTPLLGTSDASSIDIPTSLSAYKTVVLHYWRARGYLWLGDEDTAEDELYTVRGLARETLPVTSATAMDAHCQRLLGTIASDHKTEREWFERAIRLAAAHDHDDVLLRSKIALGCYFAEVGEYEKAIDLLKEAYSVSSPDRNPITHANLLMNLACVRIERADPTLFLEDEFLREKALLEWSRDLLVDIGEEKLLITVLTNLGTVALLTGDEERAESSYLRVLSLSRRIGLRRKEAWILGTLGTYYWYSDPDKAVDYLMAAVERFEELDDQLSLLEYAPRMMLLLERQGDRPRAREFGDRALEAAKADSSETSTLVEISNLDILQHLVNRETYDMETLYSVGLKGILRTERLMLEMESGMELFRNIRKFDPPARLLQVLWKRRHDIEPGSNDHLRALGSGIILAGLGRFFENVELVAPDEGELVEAVKEHRALLSRPLRVVYDYLRTGTIDSTPVELGDHGFDEYPDDFYSVVSEGSLLERETLVCINIVKRIGQVEGATWSGGDP